MKKALIALAFGTFCLGISEYVMMGILPYLAEAFHVTIPEAGHFITAYAIGVCVGAPLIVLCCRKWPLKRILFLLMGLFTFSVAAMALCPTSDTYSASCYWMMMVFRFIGGLPHGAFFATSAIVADRLSKGEGSTFAVAIMCAGMTVANMIGNPLCTLFTSLFSWRLVFGFSFLCGVATITAIACWVPYIEPLENRGIKGEFAFLKTLPPWLMIFATLLGNGGVFCWYSYISPLLTDVSGVSETSISLMMTLAGAGMVAGNLLGGRISDRFGPGHTGRGIQVVMLAALLMIFFFAQNKFISITMMVLTCACLFGVSSPQQLLLLRFSKGGELMGGAMVQIAFNLGNALGAWCGGLPIEAGLSYKWPALVGAAFVVLGIVCYSVFCRLYEKR